MNINLIQATFRGFIIVCKMFYSLKKGFSSVGICFIRLSGASITDMTYIFIGKVVSALRINWIQRNDSTLNIYEQMLYE